MRKTQFCHQYRSYDKHLKHRKRRVNKAERKGYKLHLRRQLRSSLYAAP